MSCKFDKVKISLYLDHEMLNEHERLQVEYHLESCCECASLLKDFRKADHLFAHHTKTTRSDTYWQSLAKTIEKKLGQRSTFYKKHQQLLLRLACAAAVLALVVIVPQWIKSPTSNHRIPLSQKFPLPDEIEKTKKLLVNSEAALVNFINLDMNNTREVKNFQNIVTGIGLLEQIKHKRLTTSNHHLKKYFHRLEAILVRMQNEGSCAEMNKLKDIIINNGLIQENRENQYQYIQAEEGG